MAGWRRAAVIRSSCGGGERSVLRRVCVSKFVRAACSLSTKRIEESPRMVNITMERDQKVGKWRVIKKLAEGGFGAVYQATDEITKEECAIKIEPCDQNSVLKMEAYVLMRLRGTSPHSCAFLGCGRQGTKLNFLVMTLVGRSLSDLHRARPDRKFSGATVARLAVQCIMALEDVHKIGFVHRDVKPGNLAIGRTTADRRTVFILDFGLARRYADNTKTVRKARDGVGFRGTVRYASINVHDGKEQGRHDDLQSLIYVLTEFRASRLPWNDVDDDDEVAGMKKKVPVATLLKDMDTEYAQIYSRLLKMTYAEAPDYDWMLGTLGAMQKRRNYTDDGAFEWETNP